MTETQRKPMTATEVMERYQESDRHFAELVERLFGRRARPLSRSDLERQIERQKERESLEEVTRLKQMTIREGARD